MRFDSRLSSSDDQSMGPQSHIGLVGCGRWGRNILRDLLSLGCRVTVVDRSGDATGSARAAHASAVVARVSELPETDGVIVATPTSTHYEVLCEIVERQPNRPIFCEKPLTADLEQARDIARRAGDRLFVMDKWRYHAGVLALAEIARSGELGPVEGLRTVRVQWGHPHADVDAVWVLLPHDLSIAREVFGHIPTPIAARVDRDSTGVTGLIGLLGERPWVSVEVSARRPTKVREVQLYCRDGVAILADGNSEVIRVVRSRAAAAGVEQRPIEATPPLLAELKAFVAHIRGEGPPPKSSAADGVETVRAIWQLRRLAGE